jgi:hypothetical protein
VLVIGNLILILMRTYYGIGIGIGIDYLYHVCILNLYTHDRLVIEYPRYGCRIHIIIYIFIWNKIIKIRCSLST